MQQFGLSNCVFQGVLAQNLHDQEIAQFYKDQSYHDFHRHLLNKTKQNLVNEMH